ncbi:hypothetical protein AGMMS4952_06750 [Spirochaetia bacterium]|nr:hypothetical protein AGMMS4952_06750 [Spirochaetia bacterium]
MEQRIMVRALVHFFKNRVDSKTMKKTLPVISGLLALLTLLAAAFLAGCDTGSNNNDPVEKNYPITEEVKNFNYSDWMSPIDDAMPLRNLLIPGTHDAATYKNTVASILKCQNTDFEQQLNQGIRFFDIRVGVNAKDREVGLYHVLYVGVNFSDFLSTVANFLAEGSHDRESLIVSVKREVGNDTDGLPGAINSLIAQYPSLFYSGGKTMAELTLGEVRGKIVLWNRGIDGLSIGEHFSFNSGTVDEGHIDDHNFRIQDFYNPVPSPGTNAEKMQELTEVKSRAIEDCFEDGVHADNSAVMYANYFNISGVFQNWDTAQHILDAVWENWFTRADARGIIPMDFYNGGELEYNSSTGVKRQYIYRMIRSNYLK